MAYEQKENSGAIFKNDKREKDTQPHGKGSALIDGVAYWVSSWTNESPKGRYQSLKFERKDSKPEAAKPQAQSKPSSEVTDDLTDDIPW